MDSDEIRRVIEGLLEEVEEEEIGINLLQTYSESETELTFFSEANQQKIRQILTRLAEDSKKHKKLIYELTEALTGELGRG